MTEKHVVTCPQCGFGVTDQGDVENPGLTGDIRAFTRTCAHTAEMLGSVNERPFGCPELLDAVHHAAAPEAVGGDPDAKASPSRPGT